MPLTIFVAVMNSRRTTRRKWKLRLRIARRIIDKRSARTAEVDQIEEVPHSERPVGSLPEREDSLADREAEQQFEEIDNTIDDALSEFSDAEEVACFADKDTTLASDNSEFDEEDTIGDLSDCRISDDESIESEPVATSVQPHLYPGSSISSHEFSVALLSISHKHSLTNASLLDILSLFSKALPMGAQTISRHMLMKQFVDYANKVTVHHCCGHCSRLLSLDSACDIAECRLANVTNSSFIQVCLNKQLQTLFSDVKFVELLQYRFERRSIPSAIADIYDGTIYKEQCDFFDDPHSISFTLNYDGAPKFKSSNMQVWPIQLSINELPPRSRRSKNYMLLAGLWCSTQKPPSFTFLEPVLTSLRALDENGTEISIAGKSNGIVRARLICAVMDLPAKAMILNCNQYNGAFGCSVCKHPGQMVSVGKGKARSYPYCNVQLRNHQDHFEDAQIAMNSATVVNGVKGFSALNMLSYYDVIRSTPVDYMHCVLLGVVKKLATLWFDSSHHVKSWYIGRKLKDVDERLLQIQLPNTIERTPRSITQRKFWKASEWKSFLFFYIPATLNGILRDEYYIHAFLLVKSMRILLGCYISEDDLKLAQKMLKMFCSQMEPLYGISNCGINVHSLLHLAHYVRLLGPLWTHSAFSFENQMHNLLQHSHATHGIGKQIAESFLLNQRLHTERRKLLESSSCSTGMKLFFEAYQLYAPCTGIEMVGSGTSYSLQDQEFDGINRILRRDRSPLLSSPCVRQYQKAMLNGKVLYSKGCKRVTKRNSYTISYLKASSETIFYGIIEKFLCAAGHNLACISKIVIKCKGPRQQLAESAITNESQEILFSDYMTFECMGNEYIFVSQILQVCCNLSNGDWNVLTLPVNDVEVE